jgi:hypothetical protein
MSDSSQNDMDRWQSQQPVDSDSPLGHQEPKHFPSQIMHQQHLEIGTSITKPICWPVGRKLRHRFIANERQNRPYSSSVSSASSRLSIFDRPMAQISRDYPFSRPQHTHSFSLVYWLVNSGHSSPITDQLEGLFASLPDIEWDIPAPTRTSGVDVRGAYSKISNRMGLKYHFV